MRALLAREPRLRVTAHAGTAHDALVEARHSPPDLLLMSASLPDMRSVTFIAHVKGMRGPRRTRIVVLSDAHDAADARACLIAGADGHADRRESAHSLITTLLAVHRGDVALSTHAIESLAEIERATTHAGVAMLTEREREMVRLAAGGLRNDEIARRVSVSPTTVKTHIRNAMKKLNVHDRARLVALAHQLHLADR